MSCLFESVLFLARAQDLSQPAVIQGNPTITTTSLSSALFSLFRDMAVLTIHTVLLTLYCRFPPWMDVAAFWLAMEAVVCIIRMPREPIQYILDRREVAAALAAPGSEVHRRGRPSWSGLFQRYSAITFNMGLFVWVWGLMSLVTALIKDRAEGVASSWILFIALAEVLMGPVMWLLLLMFAGLRLLRIRMRGGDIDLTTGTYWTTSVPADTSNEEGRPLHQQQPSPGPAVQMGHLRRDIMTLPMMMVFGVSSLPHHQTHPASDGGKARHHRRMGQSSNKTLKPSSNSVSTSTPNSALPSPSPSPSIPASTESPTPTGSPKPPSPPSLAATLPKPPPWVFLVPSPPTQQCPTFSMTSLASITSSYYSGISTGTHPSTDMLCAICLVQYEQGDLIRELGCGHRADIHVRLVASPATSTGNRLCPICKQDAVEGVRKATKKSARGGLGRVGAVEGSPRVSAGNVSVLFDADTPDSTSPASPVEEVTRTPRLETLRRLAMPTTWSFSRRTTTTVAQASVVMTQQRQL
ncbi:hypothetical protein BC829DRAFT_444068 [Chytridium lagenaria]|nr:hypothetical protein BC829DRAFT_444068 [Chytridium lagenaria]